MEPHFELRYRLTGRIVAINQIIASTTAALAAMMVTMASKPLRPCLHPGCTALVLSG